MPSCLALRRRGIPAPRPERAARLLGAARSEFGRHGSWRTPQGGATYVHFTAQVRCALPADVAKWRAATKVARSASRGLRPRARDVPPE
jgi:hypothetical protein